MQTKNHSGRGAALPLQRREFLVLGSAAMVGLAATNLRSDVLTSIAAPMPLLSVGFWNGTVDDLRRETGTRYHALVAADRLVAADASLVRDGARVTVHGFWRAEAHRQPLTLALRAQHNDVAGVAGPVPFYAWIWSPNARVSNTARFDVPVSNTLDLAVERLQKQSAPRSFRGRLGLDAPLSRTETAALSPVTGSRGLKLRKGVYFFAIREHESESVPSWSSVRVASGSSVLDPDGAGVLRASAETRTPFSYLVLSVDSARG